MTALKIRYPPQYTMGSGNYIPGRVLLDSRRISIYRDMGQD